MKKHTKHICLAWIVLICFLTGQYIVFSHQHYTGTKAVIYSIKHVEPSQTVSEKCSICDIMHYSHMAIFTDALTSLRVTICSTQYTCSHNYVGIRLIRSAGRSPPQAC